MSLVTDIEELLPQTQCGECGFSGCRPYAQALASDQVDIDKCPPGGLKTLKALSLLLKKPLPDNLSDFENKIRPPRVAQIQEDICIGCTKCIQACPVDAIIGMSKTMHHVISDECTGCGLCVEPCPMDCIEMTVIPKQIYDSKQAKLKYEARLIRLDKKARDKQVQYDVKTLDQEVKKDYILDALARVKQKRT